MVMHAGFVLLVPRAAHQNHAMDRILGCVISVVVWAAAHGAPGHSLSTPLHCSWGLQVLLQDLQLGRPLLSIEAKING